MEEEERKQWLQLDAEERKPFIDFVKKHINF